MSDELEDAIDAAHTALDEDRPADARAALEAALAHATSSRVELRAEALGLAAVAARAQHQSIAARALSDQALALADQALALADQAGARAEGQDELLADLLEDRAEIELVLRAPGAAAAHLRRAIALREPETAETWMALADALLRAGEHEEVLDALARAEPLAARDEDGESLALVAELRGDVALALGDALAARDAYVLARVRWSALDDDAAEVRSLLGEARAAELADDRGALAAALRALEAIEAGVEGRAEAIDEVRGLLG